MSIKSVSELDVKNKRVFCRVDFNVPLGQGGVVRDDTRIKRALPTIKLLINQGANIILASHLGRPKGKVKPELSLKPVADHLSRLLEKDVLFVDDCIGINTRQAVSLINSGDVLILENLRFHNGETKNDPQFANQLAELADVYVNDAFGTAHRAHASTVGIAEILNEKAAGLLLKDELDNLNKAFSNPKKPLVAIFGGAKVSDKLGVLKKLIEDIDVILIGGGMANTFLKAKGFNMGASKVEEDMLDIAIDIYNLAAKKKHPLLLPIDVVTAKEIKTGVQKSIVTVDSCPEGEMALDIGPQTVNIFQKEIEKAGTIVWNGPMGVFEIEGLNMGTRSIARAIANSGAFSAVGGGDSVRAIADAGVEGRISYISTGGGAFMEFMEGKTLPGVAALDS